MANDQSPWLGIELRHLAALEAVAREGSFRRAAASLGYVQSAISQQIAALERAVGRRLVERSPGAAQIELTEAGELVLQHSGAILARLKAAQADVAALATGRAGALRVGITQSVGVRILPLLMRSFGLAWPDVRLRPTEAAADLPLYDAVERGDVDLSFVELPVPAGPFEVFELMSDPYLLVVQSGSPLATGHPALADLQHVPLIGHTQCRGLARVEAQLRARGIEPEFAFRSDVNGTIQALVGAGVGAAVLPALAVDPTDELTTVRELPDIPPRVLAIVRHRDRYHSAAAQAFVVAARTVCAELQPQPRLAAVADR
jgi:DNA-binding transcriptional LysR family regulator